MVRKIVRACAFAMAVLACGAAPGAGLVSGGGSHSMAVDPGGGVLTWGNDDWGQLGSGRQIVFASPQQTPSLTGVQAISSGVAHTLGLRADGTVIAVGDNLAGQLGDGSWTARVVPVVVTGLTGVRAIEAGDYTSYAVKADGTLWAWGYNDLGQLGDGTTTLRSRPVRVSNLAGVVAASGGYDHALAVLADGSVRAWGANTYGQVGDGTTASRSSPVAVGGLSDIVAVSAGEGFSLALRRDGTVWAWGRNSMGQLGNGAEGDRSTPVAVASLAGVAAISAGGGFALAIRPDGSVWAWGDNLFGQLGDGGASFLRSRVPVRVPSLEGVTMAVAGFAHAVARRSDGTVWAWGQNSDGQVGDGTTTHRESPVRVQGLADVVTVGAGSYHTHAIERGGRVWAWGSNSDGQLGSGLPVFRAAPGRVAGLDGVVAVTGGYASSYALRNDGTVWSWGANVVGALGTGSGPMTRSTPARIPGLSGVTAVAAGFNFAAALRSDGSVWAWGSNLEGQLGTNVSFPYSLVPVQVAGLSQVTGIAAGFAHIVALRADGQVFAIGFNRDGELGDGTTTDRSVPVAVQGLADAVAVAAGTYHSLALRRDGTVVAWGTNGSGQLGDGTRDARLRPVAVAGLREVAAIGAGGFHSVALGRDGRVHTWGAGGGFVLGYESPADALVPAPVPGLSGVAEIAAGDYHTLAMRADGSVWSWGWNLDGRIGDGTLVDRAHATVVLREAGGGSVASNDWFLDLKPSIASVIPADKVPVFLVVARPGDGDVSAFIRYRAQDVGTTGSVFVFALAPVDIVKASPDGTPPVAYGKTVSRAGAKDAPVACVLAQLSAAGQLVAVTAAQLQAYVTGTLSAQGQSVAILNGTSLVNIGGATFYVGYGPTPSSMLNGGLNRGVITVPATRECKPQAPQTGWWWNPAEGGRGYSIEVAGNHIFFAAFLYDESGRSRWYVATGTTSLDGSLFVGDLLDARGGQTLAGSYRQPTISTAGTITLSFNTATQGTMVWPGGAVPLERFNIMPGGLAGPPLANQPENGWWWNPAESGRGFFIEWQNGQGGPQADLAGYMYDDAGNAVWYLSVFPTPDPRRFSGSWWSYANGQTLTGPYRAPTRVNENVAPVTIDFHDAASATMTLPGGRTVPLVRHRF